MPKTKQIHLDEQLCFQVYTVNKKFNHFYQQALKPFDLTYPQYIAMLTLWQYAPLSVKQLGEYLHLDSGTLTPLLKRLESHGWITRSRSESDERTVIIELTEDAQNKRDDVFDRVNNCFDILGLTPEEKAACSQTMSTIETKLDDYNESHI
ncbi:MarR family winged helix-turn-helix transcriptional regulator [Lentilactobacillus sunkii]|uniref:MarR family transcriptional regulator n=1 Tax=Lentilactobacillus sunkii DSM 19904 TaxID=1423808 RepID=A0A0R1L9M9_9LACO|nr:MarR family transcriptional regulator [Lentilactobacillus sunkii]KRK89940.1 MarR family transcriptional regulator [Lentilactobacillus sunkii DSM 19904]